MRTIFLRSGINLIAAQNFNTTKIQISGFSLGDAGATLAQIAAWDVTEAPLATMQGNTVLTSDDTYVYYTPDTQDRVKLTCYVSEAIAQIAIANVTVYATYLGQQQALTFSAHAAQFIKLQSAVGPPNGAPGFEWYFDLMLDVPNLLDRFDFSNLTLRLPEFLNVGSEQNLPRPAFDGHDDFFVNNYTQDSRPAVVINAGNIHFGLPRMLRYAPGSQVDQSAGVTGDGYAP